MKKTALNTLKDAGWKFPKQQETYPEVFIIESLSTADEKARRFEGERLADMLRLGGMNPKYYYFQEEAELELLVSLFRQSQYRFLHFSCHGNKTDFALTAGKVSFQRFGELFSNALSLRRLFVSACSTGNKDLVNALHVSNRGIQSITAPVVDIQFSHAAVIWASLYVSLLEQVKGAVQHNDITSKMKKLVSLFPVADKEKKTPMEFMFAGYSPKKDKGDTPKPTAWSYTSIKP
jgi:hypothetical protein